MKYLCEPLTKDMMTEGQVLVHNHHSLSPSRRLDEMGFRAWLDGPSDKYGICSCGWRPDLGTHYMLKTKLDLTDE